MFSEALTKTICCALKILFAYAAVDKNGLVCMEVPLCLFVNKAQIKAKVKK